MTRLLTHLRSNAIAYLALFVALGGTSYAAAYLPAGSVGNRQLRNHSITPDKLSRTEMGGYVRAWVSVNSREQKLSGSPGVKVESSDVAPGYAVILWHQRPRTRCAVLGSAVLPTGVVPQSDGSYVIASANYFKDRGESSAVQTFDAQGQPAAVPYNLALLCPTP
jgi:hypothetical protein